MEDRMTIRQFLEAYDRGEFKDPDVRTQIRAGWYDWFCKDESLARKTDVLAKKLKRIAGSPLINQDTMYVWFKNNCPMVGRLYDDFRIADMETGDTIYVIAPKLGYEKDQGLSELVKVNGDLPFGDPNKVVPIVKGKWQDVVNYFMKRGE